MANLILAYVPCVLVEACKLHTNHKAYGKWKAEESTPSECQGTSVNNKQSAEKTSSLVISLTKHSPSGKEHEMNKDQMVHLLKEKTSIIN